MYEIIRTEESLAKKMQEIRERENKAKAERKDFYGTLCLDTRLLCRPEFQGIRGIDREVCSPRADSPLLKGADTFVVAELHYGADYRYSDSLSLFFSLERKTRVIDADGMYLYYASTYGPKPKGLYLYERPAALVKFGQEASRDLHTPNNIGVLTPKKLKAWADYYRELLAKCDALAETATDKVRAFREKLRLVCPEKADADSGRVTVNGIDFQWSINEQGYISTNTGVSYKMSGIDGFLKLVGK